MVFHKLFGIFLHFGRRRTDHLLTEFRHQFVILRTFHLQLFQVRSVTPNLYLLAGSRKNRLLREVGEHDHQHAGLVTGYLVGETTTIYLDRIYTNDSAIGAIYIELTLV